jgi:hypothetical protein
MGTVRQRGSDHVDLMSIGEFAKRSQLSPKAATPLRQAWTATTGTCRCRLRYRFYEVAFISVSSKKVVYITYIIEHSLVVHQFG